MTFLDLPVAAGVPILVIPLLLLVWVVVQFIRGEWATRKSIDQVQKTADTFQHAWETAMQSQRELTDVAVRLTEVADTIEHVMTSLPGPKQDEGTP